MDQEQNQNKVRKKEIEPFVDIIKYNINGEKIVISYTATWCNPCKQIKPYLLNYLRKYKIFDVDQIEKSKYKETIFQYVPFFEVYDILGSKLDSIQTSSEIVLKEFFEKNGIVVNILTDDF